MKTLCCFFLLSAIAAADTYIVTPAGIWKIIDHVPVLQTSASDLVIVVTDNTPTDPTDPLDPTPAKPLEDKVAGWADTVGEPAARSAFASMYLMASQRFTTWPAMLNTLEQTRAVLLTGAKAGWKQVFHNVDLAIDQEPHTAATLKRVADGLARASALTAEQLAAIPAPLRGRDGTGEIAWLKLVKCLPCIFDAFSSTGPFGR